MKVEKSKRLPEFYFGMSADGAFFLIAETTIEGVKSKAIPMLHALKQAQDEALASGDDRFLAKQPRLEDPIEVEWVDEIMEGRA